MLDDILTKPKPSKPGPTKPTHSNIGLGLRNNIRHRVKVSIRN